MTAAAHIHTGTVKFFNHSKGYGFIQPEDGGKDVFVHIGELERSGISNIEEGDKVRFELVTSSRPGEAAKTKAAKLAIVR